MRSRCSTAFLEHRNSGLTDAKLHALAKKLQASLIEKCGLMEQVQKTANLTGAESVRTGMDRESVCMKGHLQLQAACGNVCG